MNLSNLTIAAILTILAGLSTGIGGLIVLLFKRTNVKLLSYSLGFSAGVMIYISFVELFFESRNLMIEHFGDKLGIIYSVLAFFGGVLLIALIDKLVPSFENPHETRKVEELKPNYVGHANHKLLRVGLFTAAIIAFHNFPEGMATFITSLQNPSLGIAIALAIAIHNIPEGISVAIPVYFATGSKKKALLWSLLSGIAEPIGALIAYFLLLPILNDVVFGVLFGFIAGVMVYISLDELLPTAEEYGEHHLSIYGLISGMMLMAFSLIMFN